MLMRERSHEKGRKYQRQVRDWLDKRPFLGCESDAFGNTYDVSRNATMIGNISYDISMHLKKNHETVKILYVECKYRDEITGKINLEFHQFLFDSYNAFTNAKNDDATAAQFCFVSNIPPTDLHLFMRDTHKYIFEKFERENKELNDKYFHRFVDRIHVLILSKAILGVE